MRGALVVALLGACVSPSDTFPCATSAECSGGTCQTDVGFCSFPSTDCESGQAFGDGAGDLSNTCVPGVAGVCGDGMVNTGEECDDGNMVDTDFCVGCKLATCGDGKVLANIEDCDDGNTADGDACGGGCMTCPAGAVTNPANGHCYWKIETAQGWVAAGTQCAADRGYLVSISDAAENTFVKGLMTSTAYWIGMQDMAEAQFFREDGFRQDFFNWGAAEPSTAAGDSCTGMTSASGVWDEQACGNLLPFICERSPWFVDSLTHHAYLPITGRARATYGNAVSRCSALPGAPHLVSITDATEQAVVDAITSATATYIGLDDQATEGAYTWVSGEPFSFFAWGASEPTGDLEDCVVMVEANGDWQDRDCVNGFINHDYVCELDPAP